MKHLLLITLLVAALSGESVEVCHADNNLKTKLASLPHVSSVELVSECGSKYDSTDFAQGTYIMTFRQPVDHRHPEAGSFDQRVLLSVQNPDSASLIITNGYFLPPFDRGAYRDELSKFFGTNQVSVEHRYCGESRPQDACLNGTKDKDSLWLFNNAYQAAADQHVITESLKNLFKGKWMTTGASKSGYTTVLYRYFYPNDVDVSVPFVAPFTMTLHDPDVQRYLETQSGDSLSRAAVRQMVRRVFRSINALTPRYKQHIDSLGVTPYLHGTVEDYFANDVMDHTVGLWMYEDPKEFVPKLPTANSTDDEVWNYLKTRLEGTYFNPDDRFAPYMVQASRELGLYDFDFSEYADLYKPQLHGMCQLFFTQDQLNKVPYTDTLFVHVLNDFLPKTKAHILFIYGKDDPWTGDAIPDSLCTEYVHKYVIPGNHRTEILTNTTPQQREEIIALLRKWLKE